MNDIQSLLRSYNNNLILLNEITDYEKIEYMDFEKIIIVTDENLSNLNKINEVINFFKNRYNAKIIKLSPGEHNYDVIERT